MATMTSTTRTSSAALHHIDCSDQPLDLSFHPTRNHIVAAALVDGTVEVHDFDEAILRQNEQQQQRPASLKRPPRNDDSDDSYDDDSYDDDTLVSSTPVHTQILPSKRSQDGTKKAACRAVLFGGGHDGGQTLYTGGSAGDLVGLDASRLVTFSTTGSQKKQKSPMTWRIPQAAQGRTGIQVVHEFTPSSENSSVHPLLVTGDEAGGVRLWDARLVGMDSSYNGNNSSSNNTTNNLDNRRNSAAAAAAKPAGCVQSWKVHEDYISGLENSADGYTLLSSSADCTMAVYDLRMAGQQQQQQQNQKSNAAVRRSDDLEDELLSIQIMKHGRKVVCGTGQGVLSLFSWGTWGDVSDRFPGHPASIDALLKVDEDTLLTGSSDGMIRVVQIQPDKLIGVLGDDHDGGFPIEKLAFNANRNFVGSVTHDNFIRLWDARILQEDDDDNDDDDKEEGEERLESVGDFRVLDATAMAVETSARNLTSSAQQQQQGNNSDDEWEDMDEDEEMQDNDDDDSDDSDSDDDDSDDNGGRSRPAGRNEARQQRFQSENEKFFQDL